MMQANTFIANEVMYSTRMLAQVSPWRLAWQDMQQAFRHWRIWLLLSWQDIRIRYRRSQLGPFWITISMAITIYTMGLLYGHLLRMPLNNYFPYLAAGMLSWNFISLFINDATTAFTGSDHFIKQVKLPYSIFVLRVMSRCFIIFLHNIVVLIPLYFIFHIHLTWAMLFLIPGLLLLLTNAFAFGMILAIIGARYRDIAQLIGSVIQIIFFVTPIMWSPSVLPEKYQKWIGLNPFTHFIEVVRAPMISLWPSLTSLVTVLVITTCGVMLAWYLLSRVRSRIIYWL